jgi:hypothetical protein
VRRPTLRALSILLHLARIRIRKPLLSIFVDLYSRLLLSAYVLLTIRIPTRADAHHTADCYQRQILRLHHPRAPRAPLRSEHDRRDRLTPKSQRAVMGAASFRVA